jgi:uncharacterized RDD family membrane protein YckC
VEYHLSIAGDRSGPHSQFYVIEHIRDGSLRGDTLAWHAGLEAWKPLSQLDEFDGYWPVTEEQLAQAEQVRRVARSELDRPQPWLRFWARAVDYVWFSSVLNLLLSAFIPPETIIEFVNSQTHGDPARAMVVATLLNAVTFLLFVPLEALWLSRRGTTPGKALLRIQVRRHDGTLPSYREALLRSMLVFVKGVAFCIPIFSLFVMSWCRTRLVRAGATSWDERVGTQVEHGEPEPWRYLVVTVIIAFIVITFVASVQAGLSHSLPK